MLKANWLLSVIWITVWSVIFYIDRIHNNVIDQYLLNESSVMTLDPTYSTSSQYSLYCTFTWQIFFIFCLTKINLFHWLLTFYIMQTGGFKWNNTETLDTVCMNVVSIEIESSKHETNHKGNKSFACLHPVYLSYIEHVFPWIISNAVHNSMYKCSTMKQKFKIQITNLKKS